MALRDPLWLENAGAVYNAGDYRRFLDALLVREGVAGFSDFAVSQSSPVGMKVAVAAGVGFVAGSEVTATQGYYFVANDAVADVTIPAADITNPRIDLVGVRIRDDEYSGVAHAGDLYIATGTPAGSPVAPTPPANFLPLASVAVAAGASSITNANITDTRVRTNSGLYVVCTSTTRPTGFRGLMIFETDTGAELTYYGATTGWRPPWNVPWGPPTIASYAVVSSNPAGFSAQTDLPGATVTFTAVANRRYKVTGQVLFTIAGAATQVGLVVLSGATQIGGIVSHDTIAASGVASLHLSAITTPAAGSVTIKLAAYRQSGSGTITTAIDSLRPDYILIEDIGPAAANAPAS